MKNGMTEPRPCRYKNVSYGTLTLCIQKKCLPRQWHRCSAREDQADRLTGGTARAAPPDARSACGAHVVLGRGRRHCLHFVLVHIIVSRVSQTA